MRFGASHLKPQRAFQGAVASGNCREELDLGVLLGRFHLGITMGTGKAGSTARMWSPKGGEAGNVTRSACQPHGDDRPCLESLDGGGTPNTPDSSPSTEAPTQDLATWGLTPALGGSSCPSAWGPREGAVTPSS